MKVKKSIRSKLYAELLFVLKHEADPNWMRRSDSINPLYRFTGSFLQAVMIREKLLDNSLGPYEMAQTGWDKRALLYVDALVVKANIDRWKWTQVRTRIRPVQPLRVACTIQLYYTINRELFKLEDVATNLVRCLPASYKQLAVDSVDCFVRDCARWAARVMAVEKYDAMDLYAYDDSAGTDDETMTDSS